MKKRMGERLQLKRIDPRIRSEYIEGLGGGGLKNEGPGVKKERKKEREKTM